MAGQTRIQGGQAVSIEQRILNIDLENAYYCGKELRAIALDARKLEDRLKQLEQENDALRADLLLWNEKEVKL
jgi:cell shape-determining protein MreC